MKNDIRVLSAILLFFLVSLCAVAGLAGECPLNLTRITGEVCLDGMPDEAFWSDIEPLPVIMQAPDFGNAPSERTEIRLAYDADYLYVGGRLYQSDSGEVKAPTKKRDAMIASTDWFGIIIDSFNDKENGLAFFTTPSGLRWDATVFNDAEGDQPVNLDWNTFWDVATAVTEEGWFAEFRIPFSSLRFQDADGRVVMGIITWRWIASKNETVIFPAIPQNWGGWSTWKSSKAQEVVFEQVYSRRPFYITPYGLAGLGETFDLNDTGTAYEKDGTFRKEIGLDVKYGLTSNMTMDVTVNTDFAQVEADDEQINLSRFSLFFPEKRVFFQERSSTFDFRFEEDNQFFYSRRIGISGDESVPILGGARLVGRMGGWDLGLLNMQTRRTGEIASENFGVLRLRRRVINPYSYFGGILLNRSDLKGAGNTGYGLDGLFRVSGDDYLTIQCVQTVDSDSAQRIVASGQARYRLNWQRRKSVGLGYEFNFSRAGQDYNPAMGYELRENFTQFSNRLEYGWIMDPASSLYSLSLFTKGFTALDNSDLGLQSSEWEAGCLFIGKSQYFGEISVKHSREHVTEAFSFSEDDDFQHVQPGRYSFYGLDVDFETPATKALCVRTGVEAGTFYDGRRISASIQPMWNGVKDLDVSGLYEYNYIQLPDDVLFRSRILRLRILATLSLKFSAGAFIQQNSANHAVVVNGRLRYNPREGNDLYLVYDEGYNTDRHRQLPVLPYRKNRTVLLKYTYTFSL